MCLSILRSKLSIVIAYKVFIFAGESSLQELYYKLRLNISPWLLQYCDSWQKDKSFCDVHLLPVLRGPLPPPLPFMNKYDLRGCYNIAETSIPHLLFPLFFPYLLLAAIILSRQVTLLRIGKKERTVSMTSNLSCFFFFACFTRESFRVLFW